MKEKFDLILFDLDGTLTDSCEGIIKGVQYALRKVGIEEPDLNHLKKFIGPPLIDSFMKYCGVSKEEAIHLRNIYKEHYGPIGWKENRLYEGIVGVLEKLKADGKLLGLATSKPKGATAKVLEYFELRNYFHVVSAGSTDGMRCDKADIIRQAVAGLKEQGYKINSVVMVGDTKFDVEGAHECGIPCVGVTWGFAEKGEFEACNTEYVVNTMEELLEVLK